MSDRSAVLTTLNGQVVEWMVFEDHKQAKDHYAAGIGKLKEMIQHTSEDAHWEIMLCEVNQYARSKQSGEEVAVEAGEETDWYSKYLTIMANQARRIKGARPRLDLRMWQRLRSGMDDILSDEDEGADKAPERLEWRESSGY